MLSVKPLVVTTVLLGLLAAARPAAAQTTLTMSSWVSHPSAPPGTFDAVRDGLVDGPGQMFTKKPVAGIGDVQGLKIRTGGGVADGVFCPLESIISFKLDTIAS